MNKGDVIKIIKEEIGEFDFLDNEEYLKEQENVDLLQNEEFQKQFIIDSITNFKEKIKNTDVFEANLGEPNYEEDYDNIVFQYGVTLDYNYVGTDLRFSLFFETNDLTVSWNTDKDSGDYYNEPYTKTTFKNVEWGAIVVQLMTEGGDPIPFTAFDNAGTKTQELFVRAYTEDVVRDKLDAAYWEVEKKPQFQSINMQ